MFALDLGPSPAPITINMPSSGMPWWAPFVLAGFFVLVGATIGLFSTRLSDGRKQKADDRRQWDSEIRASFTAAEKSSFVFRKIALVKPSDKTGVQELIREMSDNLGELRRNRANISPITTEGHRQALDNLYDKSSIVYSKVWQDKDTYCIESRKDVRAAHERLFTETRKALRLPEWVSSADRSQ